MWGRSRGGWQGKVERENVKDFSLLIYQKEEQGDD